MVTVRSETAASNSARWVIDLSVGTRTVPASAPTGVERRVVIAPRLPECHAAADQRHGGSRLPPRGAAAGNRSRYSSARTGGTTRASPVRTSRPSQVTTVVSTARFFSGISSLTVTVQVSRSPARTGHVQRNVWDM